MNGLGQLIPGAMEFTPVDGLQTLVGAGAFGAFATAVILLLRQLVAADKRYRDEVAAHSLTRKERDEEAERRRRAEDATAQLAREVRELREQVAEQTEQLQEQTARITQLEQTIAELRGPVPTTARPGR